MLSCLWACWAGPSGQVNRAGRRRRGSRHPTEAAPAPRSAHRVLSRYAGILFGILTSRSPSCMHGSTPRRGHRRDRRPCAPCGRPPGRGTPLLLDAIPPVRGMRDSPDNILITSPRPRAVPPPPSPHAQPRAHRTPCRLLHRIVKPEPTLEQPSPRQSTRLKECPMALDRSSSSCPISPPTDSVELVGGDVPFIGHLDGAGGGGAHRSTACRSRRSVHPLLGPAR